MTKPAPVVNQLDLCVSGKNLGEFAQILRGELHSIPRREHRSIPGRLTGSGELLTFEEIESQSFQVDYSVNALSHFSQVAGKCEKNSG